VTLRGATTVARNARAAAALSRYSGVALVNGSPGIVAAPSGQLARALVFEITDGKISRIEVIADPARLARLDLAVLA
jgi:RNA polymerase sigma-70 factor (ECF subfamily)